MRLFAKFPAKNDDQVCGLSDKPPQGDNNKWCPSNILFASKVTASDMYSSLLSGHRFPCAKHMSHSSVDSCVLMPYTNLNIIPVDL